MHREKSRGAAGGRDIVNYHLHVRRAKPPIGPDRACDMQWYHARAKKHFADGPRRRSKRNGADASAIVTDQSAAHMAIADNVCMRDREPGDRESGLRVASTVRPGLCQRRD